MKHTGRNQKKILNCINSYAGTVCIAFETKLLQCIFVQYIIVNAVCYDVIRGN